MKTMKYVAVFSSVLFLVLGSVQMAGAQAILPEEVAVIQLVNQERGLLGLAPLWQNSQLYDAAVSHSEDMVTNNFFSHTGSDGSTFVDRIEEAGYTGSPYGECIGWGYPTAEAMVEGWMNSPPHHDIIMSTSADRIGISHQGNYWTLDVGNGGSIDTALVTYQVTNNNGAFDVSPQITNDNRILWQGWDGHDYEVYSQALGKNPVQLTNNDSPDAMPQMNATGQAVWMNWDGNNWQVWYNLGSGPVQLTHSTNGYNVLPQIADDSQIYWQGWDGHDYEIYHYNPTTQATTQLTDNSCPDVAPQANANGQLTWMEYDGSNWQVCYNIGTGRVQLTKTGSNLSPQITDDGQIFWQGRDGSDFEIYRYNTGSGITGQLTYNTVDDVTPAVKNGVLVWSHYDGNYWQIYREVLSTGLITQITSDNYDNKNPRVNASGQIVWQKWDGNDFEVYLYD
jgi:hypothetical protein